REIIKNKGQPIWREGFLTDNGNEIIDVHNLKILNPIDTEQLINQIPGVVTVGIFANRPADKLLIANNEAVEELV
ncbi:MAG: ribose-5-phosphate isomerase A, partial [Pseudomonadota bacterium]|nr:ribose-5-phosphate isomerase A [Pseudomonadota bacterium]